MTDRTRRWFKPGQLERRAYDARRVRWLELAPAPLSDADLARIEERYPSGTYDSDCFPDRED